LKAGYLTLRLYGRILKPSHSKAFEAEWTSCQEATLANHFQAQDCSAALKTKDIFGRTLQPELTLCSPQSASSKMSKDISTLACEMSSTDWQAEVIKRRGEYSLRQRSARLTKETEFSSWPTICARDYKNTYEDNSLVANSGHDRLSILPNFPRLTEQEQRELTLKEAKKKLLQEAAEYRIKNATSKTNVKALQKRYLNQQPTAQSTLFPLNQTKDNENTSRLESYPTPRAFGITTTLTPQTATANFPNLETVLAQEEVEAFGKKINPRWVENLMGIPIGWVMPNCTQPFNPSKTK
jgi:hypothetical protein